MSPDLPAIALTYAGMGLGCWTAHAHRGPKDAMRACGRGAWCAMWLFASLELLLGAASGAAGPVEVRGALAAGAWTFALSLSRHPLARGGVVLPALALGLARGVPAAVIMACACLFGSAVSRVMQSRTWLAFRVIAYWLSFVGTFAVLVPRMLPAPAAPAGDVLRRLPIALLLAATAGCLAFAGTLALARTGGTPEPLDPPRALVTQGIYSRLRYPIQLAEILSVWTAIVLFPTTQRIVYGLSFALLLIVPLRLWEERGLTLRWGDAYRTYRQRVPAYLPRLRRAPGARGQ